MGDSDDEWEKTRLVRPDAEDEDAPPSSRTPVTPLTINKVLPTPPSPVSIKLPSSGGGSLSSRTINKLSLTPAPSGGTNGR